MKEIHILIGNCEIPVTKQMTILISSVVGDTAKVSFTDTGDLAEFIALSEAGSYDLFIMILNNLRWNGAGARIDRAIEVIERIKSRENAGIIALSCYYDRPDFPDRVRHAGADCFLTLPFEIPDFRAAVRTCLRLDEE